MCNWVKSRDESLESSQDCELRTKSRESGRWCDRRLIWGEPQNDIFLGTIGRILWMLGNHTRKNAVFGLNRTRRKRGESGARGRELSSLSHFFFLVNFSTEFYYLKAWNSWLHFPREVTLVLRPIFRSCFHYRSRIFLYLTYVAGGFV